MSQPFTASETARTHYRLVWSEEQLRAFARRFVAPQFAAQSEESKDDRLMIMVLLAREKYLSREGKFGRAGGNQHMNHTLIKRGDVGEFVRLVRRYETPLGTYVDKTAPDRDAPAAAVPQEALALYIDLHLKSGFRAFRKLQTLVHDEMSARVFNQRAQIPTLVNLPSKLHSCIHASDMKGKAFETYFDIDVDTKDPAVAAPFLERWWPEVRAAAAAIVETRNGYHVLLAVSKLERARIGPLLAFLKDRKITTLSENKEPQLDRNGSPCARTWISRNSTALIPVPGTLAGGFPVRMIEPDEFFGPATSSCL